jgi:hypothetical protein
VSERYFFDKQPFEQDGFAHLLTRVARANVEAGQHYPDDRDYVARTVDDAIDRELQIVLPRLDLLTVMSIRSRMPQALRHPAFGPAWFLIRSLATQWSSVMTLPTCREAAIVLAGLGLPAALLHTKRVATILSPTLDIDQIIENSASDEPFMVGFEPARTDFFYLVSGSVRSLRRCLKDEPAFVPLRQHIFKEELSLPSNPHGIWGIHPKAPGLRLPTLMHRDNPKGEVTTTFIGGWMENGNPRDPTFPVCQPIPMRILEYMMRHGALALMLMKAVSPPEGDRMP